jgi:hypothetical protein
VILFKTSNPTAPIDDALYQQFETAEGARIDGIKAALWPHLKNVKHWTGVQTLPGRCKKLNSRFSVWYETAYSQMSWYVHSGMIGVAGMPEEGLIAVTAIAFDLAAKAYAEILEVMIEEFHVTKVDSKTKSLLRFARTVSMADDNSQAMKLYRELGLDQ